ncbi:P-loop containing nucleoside triphosphate hydrolase protein [Jimgerdemannia flammicorona]|uniref:DNA 3'-5' helicase n=1 Tax=Jimgerdemannia flammicorona TaxID=994334 RepID=A0A433QBW6_9FUNG|nr:P-loop containing nucleoside triphosphate hydrolase protein [Jimgerdemannia flammicorona]
MKERKIAKGKEKATEKAMKKTVRRTPMLNVGNQVSDNFVAHRLPTKGFKRDGKFGRGRGGCVLSITITRRGRGRGRDSRTPHYSGRSSRFSSGSFRSGVDVSRADDVFGYDAGLASWLADEAEETVETEDVEIDGEGEAVDAEGFVLEQREEMGSESICRVSRKYKQDTTIPLSDQHAMDLDLDEEQEPIFVDALKALKSVWGFESFREGQLPAIRRILAGHSTLLVIPTGAGKSLCYQLPALILSRVAVPSLTLVISPTISLMQDQIRWLPAGLSGCCWTSGMTTADFKRTLSRLSTNEHKVLFISPEKLASRAFLNLCQSGRLPPIRFACVDEAHCVSEWSHNFRPSYLLLNTILRDQLRVPCILGITGTATTAARLSICNMLDVDPKDGVIAGKVVRENLKMSVSMEKDREAALVRLLRSPTFASLDSIIIYVMKQNQADTLASYLRVRNFNADSYHAGKGAQERRTVQVNFMRGHLRILVATIAFGLGLNKADVRSVIHFSMPKSLENYIQEIGRSGRDGLPSYCHHFLSQTDYFKLRSLAHGDSVDEASVRRLLFRVIKPRSDGVEEDEQRKDGKSKRRRRPRRDNEIPKRMVAIDIERAEWDFDMRREVVSTLLSYLDLDERRLVKVLPRILFERRRFVLGNLRAAGHTRAIFTTCNIRFTKSDAEKLADKFPLVSAVLKHARKIRSTFACDSIEGYALNKSTMQLCKSLDLTFTELQQSLNKLKRQREIYYEFIQPAFCVEVPEDLLDVFVNEDDEEAYFRDLERRIMDKVKVLEKARVEKVDQIFNLFRCVAAESFEDCLDLSSVATTGRFEVMKKGIEEYFDRDDQPGAAARDGELVKTGIEDASVVEVFVNENADVITTGRTVARIFHGISSPRYPALDWYKNQHWARYADYDFDEVMRLAQAAIVHRRLRSQ